MGYAFRRFDGSIIAWKREARATSVIVPLTTKTPPPPPRQHSPGAGMKHPALGKPDLINRGFEYCPAHLEYSPILRGSR